MSCTAMHCAENKEPAIEGIVGLAYQSVSRAKAPTLIDTLYDQKQIATKTVSFYFTPNFNGKRPDAFAAHRS